MVVMSCILVTGAAGFIGSHTVDRLLEGGHEVVAVDSLRTGRRANLAAAEASGRVVWHEVDITSAGALAGIVAATRPAAIIHLAALVSVQESMDNPDLNYGLNVAATHTVAEAARRHGVGRVVFASSAAVYCDTTVLPIGE